MTVKASLDYFRFNGHPMPIHWRWMLGANIKALSFPVERRSPCDRCPVVLNQYTNAAHCCTYRPQISNFLIGLALKYGDLSREKFTELINMGAFLPLATLDTPLMLDLYKDDAIGGNNQICNFWSPASQCTIHCFRNHVCAAFFCFTLGDDADTLWNKLADYVMYLENNLAWWVLAKSGFDLEKFLFDLNCIDNEASDKLQWGDSELARVWGPYLGRQESFFLSAAELVEAHKEHLYGLALGFLDSAPFGFRRALDAHPDENGNTHLPVSREEILQLELEIVREVECTLARAKNFGPLILANDARITRTSDLAFYSEYYPKAAVILTLVNDEDEIIDFQPLTIDELQYVEKLLAEGTTTAQACLSEESESFAQTLFLRAALVTRGFLTVLS